MRVKATKVGFYDGSRRRVGDVFEVPDGIKGKWFEPMPVTEAPKVEKSKPKPKGKGEEPSTLSELTRLDAEAMSAKGADDLV